MTSLAQQLQKLAVPQTSILTRDKKRASLLFDPKEAASIDRDTFYDIGISGLKELIKLNPSFAEFENNLFSITSQQVERAVEHSEKNTKLDQKIKKFIYLVGPYALLKPAQKALEWLIHRFMINEYNKDVCYILILPYHETNFFVKFLQILNVKNENDKWHWLRDVQKSGVHLSKGALFAHGSQNPNFLKFICDATVDSCKENGSRAHTLTTLFSFFCTTVIGALDKSAAVTEPQISSLLPTLCRGLSSDIPDFRASCFLIVAKLLKKSHLSQKVLKNFTQKLAIESKILPTEALLLLILIYQTQNYNTFPEKSLDNLLGNPNFFPMLSKLTSEGTHTLPLITVLVRTSIHSIVQEKNSSKKILEKIIEDIRFEDWQTEKIFMEILDNIPPTKDMKQSSTEFFSKIIQRFERQYPNTFDKVCQNVMSNDNKKHRDALSIYLNTILKGTKSENNIFEKLYHPNDNLREGAVSFFVKNFPNLNEKERNIFKNAIRERILDDSKIVVKSALNLSKKYLVQLLGEDQLLETLTSLLILTHKRNWYDVSVTALTLLSSIKVSNLVKKFLIYLPFLLPTNNDELIIALHVLQTDFANIFPTLKVMKAKTPKEITPESFCQSLQDALIEKPLEINEIVDSFKQEDPILHQYLALILFSICLPKVCHPSLGATTLKHTLEIAEKCPKILRENVCSPTSPICLVAARGGHIPVQGVLLCIEIILEKILFENSNGFLNLEAPDQSTLFTKDLFVYLLNGCAKNPSQFGVTMAKFFTKCFPKPQEKVEFFANFFTTQESFDITPEVQLRALRALQSLLRKTDLTPFLNLDSRILIPSLLIGLVNSHKEIRHVSMDILTDLAFPLKIQTKNTFVPFLKKIHERKDEILLDPDQLPLIIFSIYENGENWDSLNILVECATDFTYPIHVLNGLTKVLTFVNPVDVAEKFGILGLKILEYVGNVEKIVDCFRSQLLYNVILRLNGELAPKIRTESQYFEFIVKVLGYDIVSVEYVPGKYACPAVLALDQITREVFANFEEKVQGVLLNTFCTIFAKVENPEVSSAIGKVVKKIEIDAKLILEKLILMRDVKSNRNKEVSLVDKRKKRTVVPTVDLLETSEWVEGVILLEFLQNKKKLLNSEVLLPTLFGILKKCLEFDEQAPLEYTKQLLLSTILHCCQKLEISNNDKRPPEASFNMELVVQCIRVSQNPQTHHHALLVLSHCAQLLPEQVLHNIMAIFTFMGSSVLRHDDSYSFQIISKIIDNVIPVLTQDSEEKEKILGVLRVFVDVILDVPEHRRVPLFVKLLTTLGVEDNLYLFLLLIFESHVFHNEKAQNTPRLQASHEILDQFKPDIIIKTSTKLLEYLKELPESPENISNSNKIYLDFKKYTPKRFRHFKYTLITFQSAILSSKKLVSSIAGMNSKDVFKMEDLYKAIIINILTYIQGVTKTAEGNANSPQAQYYKVILHHCYEILDSINALLTKEMFLLVIRGLVVHNIPTVRRKALELLNNKLQHEVGYFMSPNESKITEPDDLFALLPSIIEIIRKGNGKDCNETELILQTALLTLKLLTKLLAEDFHDKFIPILTFISDHLKAGKSKGNILASTILCLAELVYHLRAHAISSLPKFMPPLLKILKTQKDAPNLLLLCSISSLHKIIEALPLFLSPYLPKIIYEVSILSSISISSDGKTNLTTKLVNIRQIIGSQVPPRVLLPIIAETYENLIDSENYKGVGPLMNILAENLSQINPNELSSLLGELGVFFMKALDIRNLKSEDLDDSCNIVEYVEDNILETLTLLVLKLSENTFRPFYYKFYDWAIRCEIKNNRIVTFYKLSSEIALKLKGLFALFAGHFLTNASQILIETNKSKVEKLYFEVESKCCEILGYVLKTINAIFEYDGQNFIDKDRFELLMQPLVDQLENLLEGSKFPNWIKSLLIPTISNFAVSTADDTLWKQLNYQILLKTRHDNPQVRTYALKCLAAVATKIGEDFLPLLPETIPFLAELLEDENEDVEKLCQNVVRDLENILGEPLQKYF